MNALITLAIYSSIMVYGIYAVLIIWFTIGWHRLRIDEKTVCSNTTGISIIIAARNEESTIGDCLEAIIKQEYPGRSFEVIVVDDHSTDHTLAEVDRVIRESKGISIRVLKLDAGESGKKTAISKAVSFARNEWIVTTDADCIAGAKWLSSLMAFPADSGVQMIMAPVVFKKSETLFGKLQELEFLSLIASAAGAISIGAPIMCNGANLAYRKEAFILTKGYTSDRRYASGDDMFLMMRIKNMFGPRSIRFVKSREAIVMTSHAPTMGNFLNQRLRWVSKSKAYKDTWIVFTSAMIFAQSFFMLISILAWATGYAGAVFPLTLLTTKLLVDFSLMNSACLFTRRKILMLWYIPLQLVYPLYVVAIGLFGNVIPYHWKGRKTR